MVIFNCDHYAALSQMIVLRYKFHKDEKAVLLIGHVDAFDNLKTDIYRPLEDKKIFDKVITYDQGIGTFEGNKERANQVICDYFQKLLQEHGIDISDIDKVYFFPDLHGSFGVFAYNKRIRYSMVESFLGEYSDFSLYGSMEKIGAADGAHTELLRETSALTGDESLIERFFLISPRPLDRNMNTHKRMVYIDYTKELSLLPNEVKEKILSIYHINRNDFAAIDTLVLPNSVGFLECSGLSEAEFPYLYQLVLDYCVADAGNVVIKKHPISIDLADYVGKMPGAVGSIDGIFPIELIAWFQNVRIKNVLSIKSSSTDKIRSYVDNDIKMGNGYCARRLFQLMHRLYVTYSLVESVDNQSIKFHHMCNYRFLKKYLGYVFPQCESKELNSVEPDDLNGNAFTMVVSCPPAHNADTCDGLQNDGKNVITVFFNGNNGFDFYDVKGTELLDQVIPIKITKTALREDILADMSDEYIYVFAKDAEIREKIRAFSLAKALYYTGIEIKVAPLEDSELELIRRGICLEDMETARREVVNCLTEW